MTFSPSTRFLIGACILNITACASTSRSSVESGQAKLLPETVTVELASIRGIMDNNGQRISVQTKTSDCKSGVGALQLNSGPYTEYIPNVVGSQSTPIDSLFRQLCEAGMPIYRKQEADWNRKFAEMTPEQREFQRQLLIQLYLSQQKQQTESDRNASQERAAKGIADALRDSKKTTTICTSSTPWYVKCETK